MPGGKTMRRSTSSRSKTAKAKTVTKAALVPMIKSVSRKQALGVLETKFVKDNRSVFFNSAINGGFAEMYSLIPPVASGLGNWQRENDDVTPTNIRTNWHIALTTSARTMNIRVVLYCLQHKSIRHYPDLAVIGIGPPMLKSGDSSLTQAYNGKIGDEDLPVNKEEYTFLKKFTFNLMSNVGNPNGDTTAGNSPNTLPSFKNLSFTYPCKKQLRYSPGGLATYPNGHAPFWILGYAHTDGTAPDVLYNDVACTWTTQMTYKDA